jgi:hypothetical protein
MREDRGLTAFLIRVLSKIFVFARGGVKGE